jgi:hypothetical protein
LANAGPIVSAKNGIAAMQKDASELLSPLTLVSHPGLPWNKVGYGLEDREPVIATYEPLSLVNPVGLTFLRPRTSVKKDQRLE